MRIKIFIVIIAFFIPFIVEAAIPGMQALSVVNNPGGGQSYSVSLQVLLFMTALSLLPGMLMAMTSFTRIIIVLSILRQAMGLAQTPTNQILLGITLFLTFFIMAPVFNNINEHALQPYLNGKIKESVALERSQKPIKKFMLAQTRKTDLSLFENLSGKTYKSIEDVPFHILLPSFITSELKTAFQIGFILFLPFLIIDLVVASVLMSMGMMMLSPLIISLPFKVMMFF
jgi:flagellar biosynthetic protein FliP